MVIDRYTECTEGKKKKFKEWQCGGNESASLKAEKKREYDALKTEAKRAVSLATAIAQKRLYDSLELYFLGRARGRRAKDVCHIKCMKDEVRIVLVEDEKIKNRIYLYNSK